MTWRDIGVYRDSDTIKYYLDCFEKHRPNDWAVYSDIVHFMNSAHSMNLGFLHLPCPFDNDDTQRKLDLLYDHCDHIFIVSSELHNNTVAFISANDKPKITYYVCGLLHNEFQHSSINPHMDWFETSRYFYRDYLPEILGRLKSGDNLRSFDVLLGRKRAHRDFVYDYINTYLRHEDTYMTYFNSHTSNFNDNNGGWQWENRGVKVNTPPNWTVESVEYYGHSMSLSQVIPIDIYNQTAYSLVAETNYSNHFTFYTEKTAKPIIARRLFIAVAGQYYLKNLRSLGFKTFGDVIDESYDDIESPNDRWGAACEQMKYLCEQDQSVVQAIVKPIVDHNFNVMMTTPWATNTIRDIERRVDAIVS